MVVIGLPSEVFSPVYITQLAPSVMIPISLNSVLFVPSIGTLTFKSPVGIFLLGIFLAVSNKNECISLGSVPIAIVEFI